MSGTAIRVEQIGKRYHLGEWQGDRSSTELFKNAWKALRGESAPQETPGTNTAAENELWALRNVSFEIQEGEVFGFLGRNGAGKSTLLKILSRITEPTEGRVEIRGKVGSLLEVGTGFHPELTGRENIFLNGSILGMSRSEIRKNFDAIVDFSEIEKFLDTPVKRYSSGMYVRLAFAVAAHLSPDILLVDEVLSVGDLGFREKCFRFLRELRESGATIVVVSHDLAQVSALAKRCLWLDHGQLRMMGPTNEVIAAYTNLIHEGTQSFTTGVQESTGQLDLISVQTINRSGEACDNFELGEDIGIELRVRILQPVENPRFGIALFAQDGIKIWMHHTHLAGREELGVVDHDGMIRIWLDAPPFLAGQYRLWATAASPGSNSADLTSWPDCHRFSIRVPSIPQASMYVYTDGLNGAGTLRWPARWEIPWGQPE